MPVPSPGAAPARNALVGLGLALVVAGWMALVADLALADVHLQGGGLVAALALKSDIATLAEMLVVTGLGLAILGGVREGFGALNRFFDAVMQRAVQARPAPMPEPIEPDLDEPLPPRVPERAAAERAPPAPPVPGRNFQILPDGSVEVETLLGTRVFASMDEARDFIR